MRKNHSGRLYILAVIFCASCAAIRNPGLVRRDSFFEVRSGFASPPDSVKPFVYWYWVSDNISKEGITRDLESMAKVGIGEAFIGNIGLETVAYGKVKVLSDEWWELTRFAISEGQRLGVDIGVFNSPGWSQSGGPWVKPEQAMRYMVSSEVVVEGGRKIDIKLPASNPNMQALAVLAFPLSAEDERMLSSDKPSIRLTPSIANERSLIDGDSTTSVVFSKETRTKGLTIDLEYKNNFTARSLVLVPDSIPFLAQVDVQAFQNGAYSSVRKFLMDRSNPMISVGPIVYGPVSVALPDITAKKFRLVLSDITTPDKQEKVGGLKEVVLSSTPKLERYIEKQMGKMLQYPNLVWDEYLWPEQGTAGTKAMMVDAASVINISNHLKTDGTLNWEPPPGKWVVRRVGLVPTGVTNAPASPEATGFEVDKMNRQHLKNHFDSYIGKILRDMPAAERKSFKHLVIDSYEVGPQNWTEGLAEDFKKKYGYDPITWLPVLSGTIINSPGQSDRFLWDLRRLVADRIAYDYVGGLRELSEKNGLKVWLENYGHWGFPSEFLVYGGQTNNIAGEFWVEGTLGNVECRAASSAAHIYGIKQVFAESYTAAGKVLERYPAYLKKRGDWSFTEGINHVLLHVYIHQAYEREPGMNAWFGTEFNRKNTWFDQSKNWIDYQRRCMFMLQQGKPVNDVCYFIGEDAPKLAGARNPEIPSGYSYDYINADVLLNRVRIENGKMVLPDGMNYSLMVMPPLKTITPELLRKIKELVSAGAIILGPKPERSPSLKNFPQADNEVKALADELWGTSEQQTTVHSFGKGKVFNGITLDDALKQINVERDYDFPKDKPLLLTHRRSGDKDIYFITNQSDEKFDVDIALRVKGKQPELWDATNGTTRNLTNYSQLLNTTKIPLHFEPAQSYFIVFSEAGSPQNKTENFPKGQIIHEIKTPWTVSFDEKSRGPIAEISFPVLQDWLASKNDSIKHYSGTAFYKNTFAGIKRVAGERIYLDLGDVKNMARIKVNGKAAGGLWTAPWKIDITELISEKSNSIEVEVVNLWVNRMIADSKLPEDKRTTWLANNFFTPNDPLQPSGLLGPVTIRRLKY
jgi:hypothetical protein